LASSRRVKKGPGRRPQSAKRERFVELRARGWSVMAAAREAGVSRSSGANWARGHKVYRNGVVVGFVAPLDRLAVRQISTRYLTEDERVEIADLRRSGLSVRAIARRLGRAPSTISRELRRNAVAGRGYRPFDAHRRATVRRTRRHRRRIDINGELSGVVAELLLQRWSPQQISRHLRLRFAEGPVDVVVSRKHLSSCVSTEFTFPPALAVGAASPLAAAHRSGSPPSPSAPAAQATKVSAADAHHPRPAVPG
jgi:transposase, IS30 family